MMLWPFVMLLFLADSAMADESTPPLASEYIEMGPTSHAVEGDERVRERQSELSEGYMKVAPIFRTGQLLSFVRLANPTESASIYTIRLVGNPSNETYATATFALPAHASIQYSIEEIEENAGFTNLVAGDDDYSLFIQSSSTGGGVQHVLYNNDNGFFENGSICNYRPDLDYSLSNRVIINVHTSQFSESFPSSISLHQMGFTSGSYEVSIYESRTGALKGTHTFQLPGNSTDVLPMSWFEEQVGWKPTENEVYANLEFTQTQPELYYYDLSVGHLISNEQFNAQTNLTQICSINSGLSHSEHIVSGDFRGFGFSKTFTMLNGDVWRQVSFESSTDNIIFVQAIIWKDTIDGKYLLSIRGADQWVEVERVQ